MGISELPLAGPGQREFAGRFERVEADGRAWLAFPAGRHAAHGEQPPSLTLCLAVRDEGPDAAVLLPEALAALPVDGQLVVVDGGSRDWTLPRCLRAAAQDARVVVYQGAGSGRDAPLAAAGLALAAAPLALVVPPGRLVPDAVAVLRAALDAAPAAGAAVAATLSQPHGQAPVVLEPWCGTGYVAGPDASAAALAAPAAALAGRPALVRTAALRRPVGPALRDALAAMAGAADVVGVDQPLSVQLHGDAPDPATAAALAGAVRSADLTIARRAGAPALAAATRSVAARLAALPHAEPVALASAAGALRRLAHARRPAPRVDVRRFRPGVAPLPVAVRDFAVLCSFAWAGQPAEGLEELLRAYVEAFAPADPVSLLLHPGVDGAEQARELEAWLVALITDGLGRSLDAIPDVVVEVTPLEPGDRPALYAAADCVVALPAGDGAVALEAMACGLAVIAVGDGAHAELVSDATGFPVARGGLPASLRAAAADPVACARRGARGRGCVLALGQDGPANARI